MGTAAPRRRETDTGFVLDRQRVLLVGTRQVLVRWVAIAVGLLLVQQPAYLVATGVLASQSPEAAAAAGRLSLLLDLVMLGAVVQVVGRAGAFVRARTVAPAALRRTTRGAQLGVAVGLLMDLGEDVALWRVLPERALGPEAMSLGAYTVAMRSVLGLSLVALLGCCWWAARRVRRTGVPGPARTPPRTRAPVGLDGTIISCSGGGIRAAAFALGGLQRLSLAGEYAKARAVVGVSGGGYVAAAYHVLRWGPTDDPAEDWRPRDQVPFAPQSPETGYVRRHTRYLLGSFNVALHGALSLAFGIAVNLLLIGSVLVGLAWVLGFVLAASGRLDDACAPPGPDPTTALGYCGDWLWVGYAWVPLALGVGVFVLRRFVERWQTLPRPATVEAVVSALVAVGSALALLLLVVPWVLEQVASLGQVEGEAWWVAPVNGVLAVLTPAGAESVRGLGAVGAIVAAVASVLASARGSGKDAGPQWWSRLWAKVKDPLVPYAAVVVVGLALVLLLLRWTGQLVAAPERLSQWWLAGTLGVLLVVARTFTDANRTSLHHFFRWRITQAFLVRRAGGRVEPIPYRRPLRWSESAPQDRGPRLVTCAVANVTDVELVPADRDCLPFVFDDQAIGITDRALPPQRMRRSDEYERAADPWFRDCTVPAALAMSAAAFSPMAGRENRLLGPYRVVLALANARLGVWLPNPLFVDPETAREGWLHHLVEGASKPGLTRVLKEAVGKASIYDRYLYVTDGGHYDNLGLVEALRRRPERVIVLDASNDEEDAFSALGKAIATARMDLGCEVRLDPRGMRKLKEERAPAGWCRGTFSFLDAPDHQGELLLAKAVMVEDLEWDIEAYALEHPDFPRTTTADQSYGEFDFEAYRALGDHTVARLLKGEPVTQDVPWWKVWA
ncbi:hypothetical protein [Nocardioides aequoreus]|uniref:hypothetical protein n=1 Tax=Nocardioides aequoreus TaxID=397278 RepID=UPI0012F6BF0E|nr:hypothetical protein [Nocardioides aequoreus]